MSSVPYFIIVDNADTRNVTVVGTNVTTSLDAPQEYDGTDIAVKGENTQVTLEFWGTSVQEYQTLAPGVPNALNFTLDGQSSRVGQTVNFEPIVPHFQIYSSPELNDGPHTLISSIQQSGFTPGLGTAVMLIDYYIVTRPAGSDVAGLTLLYDDMHPDFQYSDGSWNTLTGKTDAFQNMNWTLHATASQGSTASLSFSGSSLKVYGSIRQNSTGPIASFAIDSQPATTVNVPLPAPSATFNVTANFPLYENDGLAPGNHTLVMTALAPNMFYFDYLTVVGISKAQADASTTSSSPSSNPTAATTSSTSSTGAPPPNHSTSAGTIAGAVVGAIVGVAVLAGAIFLIFRRRRRTSSELPVVRQDLSHRHGYSTDTTPGMQQRSSSAQFTSTLGGATGVTQSPPPPSSSGTPSSRVAYAPAPHKPSNSNAAAVPPSRPLSHGEAPPEYEAESG